MGSLLAIVAPRRERRLEHRRRPRRGGPARGRAVPRHLRRRVLIRADSGGGTHELLKWLAAKSRRLHYSAGMTVTEDV